MKKISRTAKFLALLASFCTPLLAAAQINTTYIKGYSDSITSIINSILVPVLIAIAFITFLWGVYKYFILGADNETQRETGRQFTLWGIIGFVIILSLWGIVNLFMGTLGLSVGTAPKFPTIGNTSAGTTGNTSVFPGAGTAVGGTNGGTGSNVFSSNGTLLGKVNSSGQIVSSSGQTVGKINSSGQAVTNSGTPISGTTVTSGTSSGGTYQTCIDNGGDTAVCQCEASDGAWNLTNQDCYSSTNPFSGGGGGVGTCVAVGDLCDGGTGTCGYDYSSTGTGNPSNTPLSCLVGYFRSNTSGSDVTPSPYQECINTGNDTATCDCEINRGGAMDTDGGCSK